jgi:hypothetical protein
MATAGKLGIVETGKKGAHAHQTHREVAGPPLLTPEFAPQHPPMYPNACIGVLLVWCAACVRVCVARRSRPPVADSTVTTPGPSMPPGPTRRAPSATPLPTAAIVLACAAVVLACSAVSSTVGVGASEGCLRGVDPASFQLLVSERSLWTVWAQGPLPAHDAAGGAWTTLEFNGTEGDGSGWMTGPGVVGFGSGYPEAFGTPLGVLKWVAAPRAPPPPAVTPAETPAVTSAVSLTLRPLLKTPVNMPAETVPCACLLPPAPPCPQQAEMMLCAFAGLRGPPVAGVARP